MPLDTSIAMSGKPVQIANPMEMYGQMANIKNAQNQNALAQYQLGVAQRAEKSQNVLADAYAQATDPATGKIDYNKLTGLVAAGGGGAQLPGIQKSRLEYETAQTTQQKAQSDLLDAKLKQSRSFLDTLDLASPNAPAQYLAWHEANHRDPIIGAALTARGVSADQARQNIEAAIARGPAAFANLVRQSMLGTEKFMEMNKPTLTSQALGGTTRLLSTAGLGGPATQVEGSVGTVTAAPAPTTLARLQAELALLPKGDPRIPAYEAMIKKETEFAPRAVTNVNLPPQQGAFEGELGKGQAKSIIDNRAAAQDAASIIDTVNIGRDILKGGVITGAGADFLVNFNQALKTAGVDFGYADASANSQAYAANMAQNVGKIIKQFGAGTGLSDADRQYAEKMAGGKITLDAKALNKILDINERAARNVITRHNKDVAGIKTNIPLTVEMPAKRAEPVTGVTAPPVAIEYLRVNPNMKSAFDAKYGAGAADRALKGQ